MQIGDEVIYDGKEGKITNVHSFQDIDGPVKVYVYKVNGFWCDECALTLCIPVEEKDWIVVDKGISHYDVLWWNLSEADARRRAGNCPNERRAFRWSQGVR